MKNRSKLFNANLKDALNTWGELPKIASRDLKELTVKYALSVAGGDLQLLDGRWYVTHAGLLRLAFRRRCSGIRTTAVDRLSDCAAKR